MSGSLIPRRRTASAFGFCSPQAQKAADSGAPTLATDRQSVAYCAADADSLNGRAWAAIAAYLLDAAAGQFERKLGLHLGGGGGGGHRAAARHGRQAGASLCSCAMLWKSVPLLLHARLPHVGRVAAAQALRLCMF